MKVNFRGLRLLTCGKVRSEKLEVRSEKGEVRSEDTPVVDVVDVVGRMRELNLRSDGNIYNLMWWARHGGKSRGLGCGV